MLFHVAAWGTGRAECLVEELPTRSTGCFLAAADHWGKSVNFEGPLVIHDRVASLH